MEWYFQHKLINSERAFIINMRSFFNLQILFLPEERMKNHTHSSTQMLDCLTLK